MRVGVNLNHAIMITQLLYKRCFNPLGHAADNNMVPSCILFLGKQVELIFFFTCLQYDSTLIIIVRFLFFHSNKQLWKFIFSSAPFGKSN